MHAGVRLLEMLESVFTFFHSLEYFSNKIIEIILVDICSETLPGVSDHLSEKQVRFEQRRYHSLREAHHLLHRKVLLLGKLYRSAQEKFQFVGCESEGYWVFLIDKVIELKVLTDLIDTGCVQKISSGFNVSSQE